MCEEGRGEGGRGPGKPLYGHSANGRLSNTRVITPAPTHLCTCRTFYGRIAPVGGVVELVVWS